MKSNEALYSVIGEIKAEYVPDTDKKKKASPLKWAAIGSFAAAAAVVGIFAVRGMGIMDLSRVSEWEEYRIYPKVTYKENVVIDELPKIYYEKGEYRSYPGSFSVFDLSELETGNPWNESSKLTKMPVFKNLAYGEIPFRFYSKERMLSMAANAAEAMGISVDSVFVNYDWIGDDPSIDGEEIDFTEISADNGELPAYLKAVCGGEVYGVEKISIRVFGDGMIDVYFSGADDGAGMQLPEGYSFSSSPYSSEARKTVRYLSEKFKNLLQFEKPVCDALRTVSIFPIYGVYGGSENIAQSILNYSTAYASFVPNLVTDELSCITLINLPAASEYMGEYPIISADEAVKLLLDNADEYASYVPEQYLKNGGIDAEDIKKVELSYKDGIFEYLAPYYYIYAELSEIEEADAKIFGVFAVPAVKEEYISDTPIIQDDKRSDNYRIYPDVSYKDNGIDKVPQKIPYQSNEYMAVSSSSDYWYGLSQDWGNPWSEELAPQLTSLPVFKDLAFYRGSQYLPSHYYTEEQMREMAEKAAAALGVNITDTFCEYEVNNDRLGVSFYDEELPCYFEAACDGGEYGTEKITMKVYGGGGISIDFGEGGDEQYFWLPDEYDFVYESSDESRVEEALGCLSDKFKDLLQFDDPCISVYTYKYDSADRTMGRSDKIFNGSDDIVQSILNYNLAYARFDSYPLYESSFNNGQKIITLTNRLASAEYLGDYPVISPEEAKELLLNEGYYVYMPTGYFKSSKEIDPEKIVKTELVYDQTDTGYFIPYYNIYVEKDKESENGYKQYLCVQVSAIREEYFEAPVQNDSPLTFDEEILGAYPADEIGLPDGSTVSKTEAVGTDHNTELPVLQFDFAFLRYSMPIFKSTFEEPDCYDLEAGKPAEKTVIEEEKPSYFKVKKGDKLDNGLTVINAECKTAWWDKEDKVYENKVSFEGEITVEGYFVYDYSIRFYPDTAGGVSLPNVYCVMGDDPEWHVFSDISEAILTDSKDYFVGYDATLPDELTNLLEERKVLRGKVTLKNISLYVCQSNFNNMAEIVDFEILE